MGKKRKESGTLKSVLSRILAAVVVGAAGALAGFLAAGDWSSNMVVIGASVGALIGAAFGFKALELVNHV